MSEDLLKKAEESLGMIFTLTDSDCQKIAEWEATHECSLELDEFGCKKVGAIGGQHTYSFTPTGLGSIIDVKCACGAKLDLTDFESW